MKKKNNMYPWIDETRNFIGGECPHKCKYCYVKSLGYPSLKQRYSGELRLIEKELKKPLGSNKTIFIQSCGDLFAEDVSDKWILAVLKYCSSYPSNTYLFQTKNPFKLRKFIGWLPPKVILGTTIETNRDTSKYSKAPQSWEREGWISKLKEDRFRIMVSIEPIMNFDINVMLNWIRNIGPEFVSIGADSKKNTLPEPNPGKIKVLIRELRGITTVKVKDNLKRLL